MNLPKARTENLIEQNLDKETLIYDLNTHIAINLNETSTIVYRACSNQVTFDELKDKHPFTDDFIFLTLDELQRNNPLKDNYQSPISGTNRREMIKKVGLASIIMLPMITGLIAPTAANDASNTTNTNSSGSDPFIGTVSSACRSGNADQTCNAYPLVMCYSTSRDNIYCESTQGNGTPILRNESRTTTVGSIIFVGGTPSPSSNADCQNTVKCCHGATSSGICSYNLSEEEGNDGTEYLQKCTCTCP